MKSIISLVLILASVASFSQKEFQGKAVYQSKTTFDLKQWNNRELSEQQKKRIMDRMKNMLEKKYVLQFNKSASIYKEDEQLEAPGRGGGFQFGGFSAELQYKNITSKQFLEEREFFGKKFLIEDTSELPKWEMTGETKKIGNYLCYKATMLKETNEMDWQNMRRRSRGKNRSLAGKKKDSSTTKKITEDVEIPKELKVTAWYTPQIPVSNGPGEFWGLPGLILEVNSGRTTILCTQVVLNPKEKVIIEAPTKGDRVGREEYNKIVKKKMEEMRSMWGPRRGRGSRR